MKAGGEWTRCRHRGRMARTAAAAALSCLFAAGLAARAPDPLEMPPQAVVETARGMDLAGRKQLAYLYARLENRAVAEPLAEMVLAEDPGDQRILLAMASMYLSLRDAERTLDYAERILAQYPENRDGLFFLAAGNSLSGRHANARDILRRLERLYPASVRFPFELDLASASALSGDWYQAIVSYQDVLADTQLAPELRMSARRALDALYREHLPAIGAGAMDIDAGTGRIREFAARGSAPVGRRFRAEAEAAWYDTGIDPTVTTAGDSSRTERFEAALRMTAGPRYAFRLSGRTFDGKAGYGAAVRRSVRGGAVQQLSWDTRLRAVDSVSLMYLAGSEDRLNLLLEQPLPGALSLRGNAYYRRVEVGGGRLGDGGGADWELTLPLPLEAAQAFVSYRGAYSRLDIRADDTALAAGLPYLPGQGPTPETVEGLSSDRIHREGVGLLITRDFDGRWILSANAGLDYYFYEGHFAWNAGGGVLYRPVKSVDVSGDVSYSSADNRGDEDADYLRIALEVTSRF